jgi:folate-binding protein YgfZ
VPVAELGRDQGYAALRDGAGAVALDREAVRVAGPDASTYLQGQTSQDIAALPTGGSTWALVLQPQGKLDALVRVYRVSEDEFFLVTDGGVGDAVVARLNRFKLRTKVEVERLGGACWGVLGPAATDLARRALALPATGVVGAQLASERVAVPFDWGGLQGYELVGAESEPPHGAPIVGRGSYDAVRVEAGFPRHGSELDERTIPAEAGLVEASVSFTKGCYTGQELVARIDSRGSHVARRLRGITLSGWAAAGEILLDGERVAGKLTSVAWSPRLGWVALGYVARGVEVGAKLVVRGGAAEAVVVELPIK